MQRSRRESNLQQQDGRQSDVHSSSYEFGTNDAGIASWGNGATAQGIAGNPNGGDGFTNSITGITHDLGQSNFAQGSRDWGSFYGGGLGLSYGGNYGTDSLNRSTGLGVGVLGGGGSYTGGGEGYSETGYAGGAALAGRIDQQTNFMGNSWGGGGDLYRGVGGSAYQRNYDDGRTGYGATGGYTAFGVNDGYSNYSGIGGDHSMGVGSAEFGRVGGDGEVWSGPDGSYGFNGGFTGGRNVARDLSYEGNTALGNTTADVGSVSQGRFYRASGGYDAETGRYGGQVTRGGALTVEDANVNHDWGNGMSSSASVGRYGANETSWGGGYNPTTGELDFNTTQSTGLRLNDVHAQTDLPGGGNVNAGFEQLQTGSQWRIDEGSHIGPDGMHVSGGGHWGGWDLTNAGYEAGWDGVYENNGSVGNISTRSAVNGASLDVDGNGVRAGFESIGHGGISIDNAQHQLNIGDGLYEQNTQLGHFENGMNLRGGSLNIDGSGVHAGLEEAGFGGFSAENIGMQQSYFDGAVTNDVSIGSMGNNNTLTNAQLDITGNGLDASLEQARVGGMAINDVNVTQGIGGMTHTASLGEFSNDVMVDGARFHAGADGVNGGFDQVDFGGVRFLDANYSNDLGGYGNVNASMGSFTNGNNFTGGEFNIDENGVTAGLDSFGVAGTDIQDVDLGVEGPGGINANAHLGSYHSGVAGSDLAFSANGDGVNLSAGELSYAQHQINDASVQYGIDGVYDNEISVGQAGLNNYSAEGVNLGVDENGVNFSADRVGGSYIGVEDFQARQELFDGAVGTNVGLDRGSYLGGSAENLQFQSDLLGGTSSGSVDNLNLHGLQLEGVDIGANVGDLNANVGAEELNVLDLNVGNAEFESSNYGLTGRRSVTDAQLDVLQADDLSAGIGWGDQNLLSASTDLNASLGVDHFESEHDLLSGTASTRFENANANVMMDDTSIGIGDYNLDIGRTGANINASGGGDVDVFGGTANGDLNLAGSELALFGQSVELGDWAQASGGVDVSEGAANWNVGGENGVGADMNLSEGNLDLNIGGHEIDVDEGIRDGVEAVGDAAEWVGDRASDVGGAVVDGARSVGRGIRDGASAVGGAISDGASAVGGAISDGASAAWDAVTSW